MSNVRCSMVELGVNDYKPVKDKCNIAPKPYINQWKRYYIKGIES